jgi:putative adhesin
MAEHCKTCGIELFTAQRFCRSCGAPTEQLSEEQVPTRMMPPQPEAWGGERSGARTGPTSRQETSPVYDASVGYQPIVPPTYPSVIPPYTPPRKRSPVGWILAFVGMGLFVLIVIAVMMVARFGARAINTGDRRTMEPARQGEKLLDESSAETVVTAGADTTFTKTFVLGDNAKVFLRNVNGNITVSAWDQPQAQVNVIKRGGSDRGAQVLFTSNGGNLSIRTVQTRGNQDVRFEVKVPRDLGRVELSSTNGVIRVSDVNAEEILVEAINGAIDLANVSGVTKIHTTNGSIKASLLGPSDRSMEFESTNGSIDLTVPPGFDADLDASTSHGAISLDESFGVPVEKGIVGQKAKGEIGQGGERLKAATTNGNVKIATAEPRANGSAKGKANAN